MDELKPIILLVTSGILLRFSLTFTGQAWAKSHAQTVLHVTSFNYLYNNKNYFR